MPKIDCKHYIYTRTNKYYESDNVVKLGETHNTKDRNNTYITGEYYPGWYIQVFEILNKTSSYVEKELQQEFKSLNDRKGGGKEFYSNTIIDKIEPYLVRNNIEYRKLTKEEILCIESEYNTKWQATTITNLKMNAHIIPYDYQLDILNNLDNTLLKNEKGILLWSCGLGKTIMALMICCKLQVKNILIGVPSKNLILQWKQEIIKHLDIKPIMCYDRYDNNNIELDKWNTKSSKVNIMLTTYHSSHKVNKMFEKPNFRFDIKIGDEAHHLVTDKKDIEKASFDKFHIIPSRYSLYMTATTKHIDMPNNNYDNIYNMNNKGIFGDVIDEKSVKWAITNNKIADYSILSIYNQNTDIDALFGKIILKVLGSEKDVCNKKELFMSAYFALQSLNDGLVSHILIYANTRDSAMIIKKIIDKLLEKAHFKNINNNILNNNYSIYNNALYSNDNMYHNIENIKDCDNCKHKKRECVNKDHPANCNKKCRFKCYKYSEMHKNIFHNDKEKDQCEICKFKNAKYGIISCVYIFGEGFDLPKLNGIVIGEKMTSEIRIVQSCLRPNRLDKLNPNKKAYIIIPINIFNINESNSNSKLLSVIKHMGTCDDSVEQKINLVSITPTKPNICYLEDKKIKVSNNKVFLNKLLTILHSRKCFGIQGLTLDKEYLQTKNLYNGEYKYVKDYKDDDNIELKNPDIYFGKYWEGWFTFLGIDSSRWINSLSEWKAYCKNKKINTYEKYLEIAKTDYKLTLEPEYYYHGYTNFDNELNITSNEYYY